MSSTSDSESSGDVDEESEHFEVEVTSQGKRYLEIPHVHMSAAGMEEGDEVGIMPVNHNGRFCLLIDKDESIGVSRSLRQARGETSKSLLTIPKRVATAARLTSEPITYNSGDDKIIALIQHTPQITGSIEVYNITEVLMSRWKSGVYAYQIPKEIYSKIQPGEKVWFWYDILGEGFVFVLEVDEANAPDGAIELNVQETEKAKSDYLVHLPKQICDALEVSGAFMKWGHDGERILGLLQ